VAKVFSIDDFRKGLDVRKTALTAPAGSVRILENAVINQGGEIEKRFAFVAETTLPAPYQYIFGQGSSLHAFAVGSAPAIPQGTCPVPLAGHAVQDPGDDPCTIVDVEAFDDKFFVCGRGASGLNYVWYDGALVHEVDSSQSRGTYARTFKTKMYRIDGAYLRFSGVGDPAQNDPSSVTEPGAGFIHTAISDPDGEQLQGMEVYYSSMAVLSRLQTQIWALDPDPTQDQLTQVLRIGTNAPHSIVQFGTGDVLFLSDSGVRSLKAMYVNLAASVSDVGSAVDLMLIPIMRSDPAGTQAARAIVQPIQGRYWLYLDGTIYVLSYFPAGDITAWSTFLLNFTLKQFGIVENQVFCLGSDNTLYQYGGPSGSAYDPNMVVTVRTPHHSSDEPTRNKRIQSVDVMCEGPWSVSIGMLPNSLDAFELVANITDNTFGLKSIPFAGYGTHFGIVLTHQGTGPATLAAIHVNIQEGVVK
jgi:hypothetical protein